MLNWEGEDLSPNKDKSIERFQIIPGKKYNVSPSEGGLVKGNEYKSFSIDNTLMRDFYNSTYHW